MATDTIALNEGVLITGIRNEPERVPESSDIHPNPAEPEQRLNDYTIVCVAGKGKFSEVFKATRDNNRVCALKKFSKECMETEGLRKRVEEEIALLQSLDHPNIVKHLGMFTGPEGEMYIELEWADGGDLRQLLKRHKTSNAHFSEALIWNFFVQIARGVHHMHENRIMHRDLKPANILVMRDSTIKVADLGLSKKMSEVAHQMHSRVGTPLYMAPEVLMSRGYSFSSDVWSMGCILYEMISLVSPFKTGSPEAEEDDGEILKLIKRVSEATYCAINEKLPYSTDLRNLVGSMLIPNPDDRIGSQSVLQTAEHFGGKMEASIEASSSPPPTLLRGPLSMQIAASNGAITPTNGGSRESSRYSLPLPSPTGRRQYVSPRTSFSEYTEVDKRPGTTGFRPPALFIPGDAAPPSVTAMKSPHSAKVTINVNSPHGARLFRRRFSAEARGPDVAGGTTSPVSTPLPPQHGKVVMASAPGVVASGRNGIPQSPRLSRLVSSGLTIQQPNSPKSAQPYVSSALASPRSARLPRALTSSPIDPLRRHRRAISATADLILNSPNSNSESSGKSPAGVRESSGSEVSSPATPGGPSDDEEKRSQNEGARLRGSFHRLSVATDRESLRASSAPGIDLRTAPVVSSQYAARDFRRPRILVTTASTNAEASSPFSLSQRSSRLSDLKFPSTPTSATNASETQRSFPRQRTSSNPFSTPSSRMGLVSPEGEGAGESFVDSPMQSKPRNPFASQENPFATGGLIISATTPRSARSSSMHGLGEPMSAILEETGKLASSPTTPSQVGFSEVGGGGAIGSYKFSLWSNAGAKKRSQASLSPTLNTPTSSPGLPAGPESFMSKASSNQDSSESLAPYILGTILGEGSFAKVYRAVDPENGLSVAVKQMQLSDTDSEAASQMKKEILLLQTLSHPNLVRYIGVRRVGDKLNIILEFCTEGSITSMLKMYNRFPERLIRLYTKQMVDALIYLHDKDIIHRDIKGGNVLVQGEGLRGIVKLSDFGCSKKLSSAKSMEKSFKMKGTVLWMAPEAASQEGVGKPSDIWSLGATVIEMATGKPPWTENGPLDEIPALIKIATTDKPPSFPKDRLSDAGVSFLQACMYVDPSRRATAKQLAFHNFLVVEQSDSVATAEVGRKPDIVGSHNALLAEVKGRNLAAEREHSMRLRMKKTIGELMNGITRMDETFAWSKVFTKDAQITMPAVTIKILGLPCAFGEPLNGVLRIVGIPAFEAKIHEMQTVKVDFSDPDHARRSPVKFIHAEIENSNERIQVESRTAMWKWELQGSLPEAVNPARIYVATGSVMTTFETTGNLIKSVEFVWDATGFIEKLGLAAPRL